MTQPILAQPALVLDYGSGQSSAAWMQLAGWAILGALAFHLAYAGANIGFLAAVYLFALVQLSEASTWRRAFYPGLVVGLMIAAVRLAFFWRIFSGGALGLWIVYAFWIALFVALARLCRKRFPGAWGLLPLPFLWCGLEYFRSELYYLRFAWLTPGFAFGTAPRLVPLSFLGVYGAGFFMVAVACAAAWWWRKSRVKCTASLMAGTLLLALAGRGFAHHSTAPRRVVHVAGVQLEFPAEPEVLLRLTELARQHPEAELLVLSEFTLSDPPPASILNWCRKHQKYVLVGGKDPLSKTQFYNTAFVVSPAGEVIFRQAKSVPIQFIRDGLPARAQKPWDSPWGKLGICICYDLSYSRVTDRLVRQGAEALVVPTMDVADWGEAQHRLHARVAPLRAAEYGIPVFRLASSGISQVVDRMGEVQSSAPYPGEAAFIAGTLELRGAGQLPWDRYLGPFSSAVAALLAAFLLIESILGLRFTGARHFPEVTPV